MYGADILIFEGILSFHKSQIADLMDMKVNLTIGEMNRVLLDFLGLCGHRFRYTIGPSSGKRYCRKGSHHLNKLSNYVNSKPFRGGRLLEC
jgi:uridine kinase